MRRNLHTVLSISAVAPERLEGRGEGSAGYYYGSEPVLAVTLDCQLVMLPSWTRGTYEEAERAWSQTYPPLMPAQVLQTLSPEALRREDQNRLQEAFPQMPGRDSRRY
jgi:hypothetical protein